MRGGDFIEQLESRVFLTATPTTITSVIADNRGMVTIYFSGPLEAATVNTGSVRLYTAGPDGQLNTADDIEQSATVHYYGGQDRIGITASIPLNTAYCILVRGNAVLDANGNKIHGDFTGTFPTVAAGSFEFDANVAPVNTQVAIFYFSQGQHVNVDLFSDVSLPLSIPNFLYYVNNGTYDGTFIHRIGNNPGLQFVQGGSFFVKNNPVVGERPTTTPIADEPAFSNVTGTLSMANTGSPDSTSDEWFFNVGDDSDIDGNYSVIGSIANSAGLTLLQNIDDIPQAQQLELQTTIVNGVSRYGTSAVVSQLGGTVGGVPFGVPTFNPNVTAADANPATDFIIIQRVAIRDYITAVGAGLPAIASAPKTSAAIFADGMSISSATPAIPPLTTTTTVNTALDVDPDKLKL